MTNSHFNIIFISPFVYLSIIPNTLSGKYLSNSFFKSGKPTFNFIKFNILNFRFNGVRVDTKAVTSLIIKLRY